MFPKSFRIFVILVIFTNIAISVPSGAVLAQESSPWPPRTPNFSNQSGLSISNITPADATGLALAMGVPSSDLLAADLMTSDPAGVGVSDSSLGTWFPTEGSTFAILSTGLAANASTPNNSGNLSTVLGGLNNDQGNDLVRLHLQLKVPSGINCASFDFAFYSEEFPEFVGSSFNDTFTAQLNNSSLTTGQNNIVVAPGNFAFDTQNHIISVNTVFGYSLVTGTTYDGVTPLLRARTIVVPGATINVYLSTQDLGDSVYDSAIFLDKFFWSEDPTCSEEGALADTDGDGLLDVWETDGLTVSVGGVDEFVNLPAMGANPNHKDIFVEADYMVGHQPNATAIWVIADAFENAPVTNPDGTTGIHLHVDYGPGAPLIWATGNWGAMSHAEELTHQTNLGTCTGSNYDWGGLDTIKLGHFTAGRAAVFHYNVWAHDLCTAFGSTSGISRNGAAFGDGASDFIVSLGSWTGSVGSANEQAGTFMHELGHNLGLRHGGEDHTQWKPNYISVMNYAFQTRGLFIGGTGGYFDYSRYDLPDLNENNLTETTGISAPTTIGTYHFCGLNNMVPDTDASSVDWNCDGDQTDTGVSYNINQGMSWNNNSTLDTLTSQNDWLNLVYSGGAIGQPGASVILPTQSEVVDIDVVQDAQIPPSFDAPVAFFQSVTTTEDTAMAITLTGTVADGDPLTYTVVAAPSHGVLTGSTSALTYTPAANYNGPDSFTFKVNDTTVDSNIATVSITVTAVNDAPVANAQSVTTAEDTATAITLTATDADGDPLTYSVVAAPSHGVLTGSTPALTYTPAAKYNGPDSFTFKANDGTVDSNIATVTITVTPVNDPPVAVNDAYSMNEDTVLTIAASAGVLVNDTDMDGDALTAVLVTSPAHGALTLNANGSFTYTPAANYFGSDSFTYKANDGTLDSNVATVTITVTDVPEVIYLPIILK